MSDPLSTVRRFVESVHPRRCEATIPRVARGFSGLESGDSRAVRKWVDGGHSQDFPRNSQRTVQQTGQALPVVNFVRVRDGKMRVVDVPALMTQLRG